MSAVLNEIGRPIGTVYDGNAINFGAVGDGVRDDTAALQTWLDSGSRLYLPAPASHYKITSALTLSSDQFIYGDGYGSQIRQYTADTNIFAGSSVSRVTILDLGLYGIASTTAVAGVYLTNCADVEVNGCEFQNFSFAGIYCQDGANSRIAVRGCYFHDWPGALSESLAIGFLDYTQDSIAENNVILAAHTGILVQNTNGVANSYCRRITLRGNTIRGLQRYGIVAYRNANPSTIEKIHIEGNRIEDIDGADLTGESGAGIYCQGCSGVSIIGNYLRNTNISTTAVGLAPGAIGVNLARGDHVISGNVIESPVWAGVYLVSQAITDAQTTVTGNTVTQYQHPALWIIDVDNVAAAGNSFATTDTTARAILINNTTSNANYSITGNRLSSAIGGRVVEFIKATDLVFSGNQIIGTGTAATGLTLDTCMRSVVSGNGIDVASTGPALLIASSTQSRVTGNICKNDGASAITTLTGTCTGSLIDRTNYFNSTLQSNGATGLKIELDGAIPGAGTYVAGDTVWHAAPAAGASPGAICTTGGSPGTWKAMAILAA